LLVFFVVVDVANEQRNKNLDHDLSRSTTIAFWEEEGLVFRFIINDVKPIKIKKIKKKKEKRKRKRKVNQVRWVFLR
jgi:hypothetical protein